MGLQKSVLSSTHILITISLLLIATGTLVLSVNVRGRNGTTTTKNIAVKTMAPISEARQFGGETNFQNWKIWDRPEDQLAVESMNLGNAYHNHQTRTKKLLRNLTAPAEVVYVQEPKANNGDNNAMQRNDCNSNAQVSILPIILAIISIISGVIGVIVLWFIAKSTWFTGSGSNGVGYGAPSQGWSSNSKNFDTFGFARNLKNLDIDQLTNIILKGIESYKKAFEISPSSV